MGKMLIVDAAALAAYVVVSLPQATGVAVHEWLGLGVALLLVVHVAQHGDWLADVLRAVTRSSVLGRGSSPAHFARLGRLVLDALLAVALAVCVTSGLMVSGAVLPAFGLYAEGYYFWNPLHAVSAKVLLALLLVHVALNAGVVYRLWKKKSNPAKKEASDE
ncbi:MAG: DUF4405 domain-containing protein [Eggerthellaceae bacterium]|nr:DUF4405 domain-containing protein [Eggerthellaceae bacterium]